MSIWSARLRTIDTLAVFGSVALVGLFIVTSVTYWSQHEAIRESGVTNYFFSLFLVAGLAALQLWFALGSRSFARAVVLLGVAEAYAVSGALTLGFGSQTALPLYWAGVVGLVAGALATLTSDRRLVALVAGIGVGLLIFVGLWAIGTLLVTTLP